MQSSQKFDAENFLRIAIVAPVIRTVPVPNNPPEEWKSAKGLYTMSSFRTPTKIGVPTDIKKNLKNLKIHKISASGCFLKKIWKSILLQVFLRILGLIVELLIFSGYQKKLKSVQKNLKRAKIETF